MEESLIRFKEAFHLKDVEAGQYSPLVLAYIGDAVYELIVRTKVVNGGNAQVNKLHKKSAGLVRAPFQAAMVLALKEELTPEALSVYKRGRNARSATMAKNATMTEYRTATGFEALVGWLYLSEQYGRLFELVSRGLVLMGEMSEENTDEI